MEDYRLEQTGQEVQDILNGAAMDANLQAEVERATEAEGRLQDNIDAEERARQDADGLLQQGIDDEAQRAKDAEESNAGEIEGIKALIPSTASEANKLADTNFVNSSIQTATAEYRGDYNVVTDLHLAIDATHSQIETLLPTVIATADKNDYCYVMIPTSAETPTEIAKIERYKMTSEGWKFEYDVNNSTFTAEEWAAIKSGITSGLVGKLNALPTNADLLLLLAGKQDVLTFDSVPVPESNNPVKSGGVYSAIDDEKTARLNSDTAIHTELDGLQAKVPATASSDNKLVDQNQMNTSISTATATYRGDWNVVSDLHLAVDATRAQIAAMLPTVIATADNNDYCYVEIPTSAETPTQIERVERYKFNGTAWGYEYVLNNSGFTADQWAAINSMITSGLVAKLTALPTNTDLLAMFATKQDVLTFDSTPTENSTNPVTSGGVFAADKALSDAIEAILLLIPSAASSLNKLVDTSLMNSSISTATATFRGTYNLVSDLGLGIDATEGQIAAALLSSISTADNNDYAFVQIPTSAETPAQIARTDRYKFNGTAWAFEYTLNTSGFTAAQWAAINSTITSALVAKLNALPTAAELQEALGVLTSGITAINQKIPSTASQANKLVDASTMESYIAQVINILDASFNVTSTDGHITLHITQVDGVITSVQVQSTDIASAADLALKASQADLTALASRVTTAEGNITSLTGRMGTAETNIANLQQLYNNLQQSKPVPVTALPSTGQQQGVIYRLSGTTSYSDYMWNGSTWVLMATYNNAIDPRPKKASQNLVTSGGVFDNMGALDVSELNATENPHTLAQYVDLSAALAAIPTDYQKGGMSIKFVQSSDNKYVQFRLMSDSFNTTVANWQGVDDEPTAGSGNLVKSGGVAQEFSEHASINPGENLINSELLIYGYVINSEGAFISGYRSYAITPYIKVNGKDITASSFHNANYSGGNVYDVDMNFLRTIGDTDTYTYQNGDYYVRFCFLMETSSAVYRGKPRANYGTILLDYSVYNPIDGWLNGGDVAKVLFNKIGILADSSKCSNVGYLNMNDHTIKTSGFGDYRYSDRLFVKPGCVLKIKHTNNVLNTQIGAYFKGSVWVRNIDSTTPADGVYTVYTPDDVDYDNVIVNFYNPNDSSSLFVYCNWVKKQAPTSLSIEKELIPEDLVLMKQAARKIWKDKTWVALGDSFTEGAYVSTCSRYTDEVSQYLGLKCINLGVGGSSVRVFADNLTQDIAESADLITIWGSINDMSTTTSTRSGEITDEPSHDVSATLMAKWKYTIEKVLSLNPTAKIIIIGCPISFASQWNGYNAYNEYGDTIKSSVDKIGELAKMYSLPFINMYELSGFNSYNYKNTASSRFDYDQVHPNKSGVLRLSNILIGKLIEMSGFVV